MNPLDALLSRLGSLGSTIGQYVQPSLEQLGLTRPKVVSPIPDVRPQPDIRMIFNTPTPSPTPSPIPQPIPTPTLIPDAPVNPYMGLLAQYFPPQEVNNASNVMFRESSFNPQTIHRNEDQRVTSDYGPFQINDYWQRENLANQGFTIEDMLDPEKAIRFAAWLQAQQGWSPWATAPGLGLE